MVSQTTTVICKSELGNSSRPAFYNYDIKPIAVILKNCKDCTDFQPYFQKRFHRHISYFD